jgi:hypothetical protein
MAPVGSVELYASKAVASPIGGLLKGKPLRWGSRKLRKLLRLILDDSTL